MVKRIIFIIIASFPLLYLLNGCSHNDTTDFEEQLDEIAVDDLEQKILELELYADQLTESNKLQNQSIIDYENELNDLIQSIATNEQINTEWQEKITSLNATTEDPSTSDTFSAFGTHLNSNEKTELLDQLDANEKIKIIKSDNLNIYLDYDDMKVYKWTDTYYPVQIGNLIYETDNNYYYQMQDYGYYIYDKTLVMIDKSTFEISTLENNMIKVHYYKPESYILYTSLNKEYNNLILKEEGTVSIKLFMFQTNQDLIIDSGHEDYYCGNLSIDNDILTYSRFYRDDSKVIIQESLQSLIDEID